MSIELRDHEETAGRDGWMVLVMTFSAFAMIVMLFAAGVAVRGGDGGDGAPTVGETIDVTLGDLFVEPSSLTMPANSTLTLNVTNDGAMAHDLKVQGTEGTQMLEPGASETITIGPFDASTEAWCTVPGHKEGGMLMAITVEGGGDAEVAAAGGAEVEGAAPGGAEIDFDAEPDADWEPFDPELAPAPGGTEHEVTWHMTEQVMEIAPGVTQQVWTFDGQVPGPTLRGKLGDIFTVTIVNDGEVGHSLDFHASKVAWDDEMRTIEPGESLVYQFEAKHAGAFMYHCGTAPTLHHIGNGMHGAIIIDPPGLAPVDHEFVFVQSEWYTGAEGEPGDLGKMQREAWDAVVFNGYVNQYAQKPIDGIQVGERVRAWVVDSGPSENSSWHVVGTVFDTLFKEGAYQLRPDETRGGAQALDLQPAQGGFVEFTFDEDGLYPFVTHKFANVGKGALGLFAVGAVDASEAGGH
jgi:nitrite reductase (NO-forming)